MDKEKLKQLFVDLDRELDYVQDKLTDLELSEPIDLQPLASLISKIEQEVEKLSLIHI